MSILQSALAILLEIIQNNASFHQAIKTHFEKQETVDGERSSITAFVGCTLRHYIVYNKVGEDYDSRTDERCRLAIGLTLSNALFLKRLDNEIAYNFTEEVFKEQNMPFDKAKFVSFIDKKINNEPLINPKLDRTSFKFISERYNISEWIIKMWSHNFGKPTAFKIARAYSKNPVTFLRVNNFNATKEQVLTQFPEELKPCEFNEDLLVYSGKEAVKRKKFTSTGKVYQMNSGLKVLLDKLEINELKPVYVFSGTYNMVPLELQVKYNNALKIDNLTTPNKDMFAFKNNLGRYKIKNVRTIEATPSQIITAVSEPVSLFILLPESSNFERLRIDPDYFLHFDRMSLDGLIENQEIALKEAGKYIEDGGLLVYAVPTLDKKEGQNLIEAYLLEHQDFELVEEKQFFPHEKESSTLYYAILRKKEK